MRRLLFLLIAFVPAAAWAQTNDDCMTCHGDPSLVRSDGSSVHVAAGVLAGSVHDGFDCVACHGEMSDFPHPEHLPPPRCGDCHDTRLRGGHGRVACSGCHGSHEIRSASAIDAPALCVRCHRDTREHAFSSSRHASSGRGVLCATCHSESAHAAARNYGNCSHCHEDVPAEIKASVHAGARGPAGEGGCTRCHSEHGPSPALGRAIQFEESLTGCVHCHERAVESYRGSIHGTRYSEGEEGVPICQTCHGRHAILGVGDPLSPTFPTNVIDMCLSCHGGDERVRLYETSVHGRGLMLSGLLVSPTCASCHGAHEVKPGDDPDSPTQRVRVAATCGTCHEGSMIEWRRSAHGRGFSGEAYRPTCTDCHGEHSIEGDWGDRASAAVCVRCHSKESEVARSGVVKAVSAVGYFDSFHGVVNRYSYKAAASCASCHGHHAVLPASDLGSTLSEGRRAGTCNRCHGGRFTTADVMSSVHHAGGGVIVHAIRWLIRLAAFGWLVILAFVMAKGAHPLRALRPCVPCVRAASRPLFAFVSALLAITGASLLWPGGFGAALLTLIGFVAVRVIHRVAAVLLIVLFLWVLWRALVRRLAVMFLGRWLFIAVVGIAVATGLVLWMRWGLMHLLSRAFIDLVAAIHSELLYVVIVGALWMFLTPRDERARIARQAL